MRTWCTTLALRSDRRPPESPHRTSWHWLDTSLITFYWQSKHARAASFPPRPPPGSPRPPSWRLLGTSLITFYWQSKHTRAAPFPPRPPPESPRPPSWHFWGTSLITFQWKLGTGRGRQTRAAPFPSRRKDSLSEGFFPHLAGGTYDLRASCSSHTQLSRPMSRGDHTYMELGRPLQS